MITLNELYMENYEKKYKEALKRAKDLHDNHPYGEPGNWWTCEKIFPELKESEDERIRKEIIAYLDVQEVLAQGKDGDFKKWIAWLEKQCERTDYNPYKATIESIAAMVENYANNGDLKDFYNNVAVKCHDAIEYDKTWKKQGEQKADWNQEDETNMDAVWRACGQAYGTDYQGILGDWLKLLKERVQLQSKQEWSEEDEARYWSCLRRLGTGNFKKPETINSKWFKEHIIRQPNWKPSEEQMRVLQIAIKDYGICHEKYVLESLYNNLKNL